MLGTELSYHQTDEAEFATEARCAWCAPGSLGKTGKSSSLVLPVREVLHAVPLLLKFYIPQFAKYFPLLAYLCLVVCGWMSITVRAVIAKQLM